MKKGIVPLLVLALLSSHALAKLPPPGDEEKARMAEIKNKSAWSDKVAAYRLCQAQDRVAARYLQEKHAPKPSITVPPCQDPGAYVPAQASTAAVGRADSKPMPEVGAKK